MSKALKAAIEANDPEAVRKALNSVKDINRKLPGASKPLLYACEKGADKVLEVLFEAGAIGESSKLYKGDSPFAVAAEHNQAGVLEKLWLLKKVSVEAVDEAFTTSALTGREAAVRFIVTQIKPEITGKIIRLASSKVQKSLLELLLKNGGDVNAKEDVSGEIGITAFHAAAHNGNVAKMRMLAECGANVNAVDDVIGKTPLMMLAVQLEWEERRESPAAALAALDAILELGADASAKDNFGNDAIDYCEFAYGKSAPNPIFIKRLHKAGAKGDPATTKLFSAIRSSDVSGMKEAIRNGADVNRICPYGSTPLIWADKSEELVGLLLDAGADPNKRGFKDIPIISAAGSGNLQVIKKLIAAGADIHAVCQSGEYLDNAYSAASENSKHDVADYLKSLGASKPKPTKSELLQPGVESWNDFSELLVKSTVAAAAEALAKIITGKVQLNVYGQSLLPGKQAYVVVRPKGMNWCNVFQIAPPRLRFENAKKTEAFARELAKVSGASVLSVEYSDTSDAATVFRAEPDGKSARDAGWDRDTLEEIVGAMGDEAPAWAKKQLAKSDEDDPSSTERLELLAKQEKFVIAAFGLDCESGRKLDVDFTGYAADVFDGVAFVSN